MRLFCGAWLPNKSKLHLSVGNANESTRSRFWARLWSMLPRKHFPTHWLGHSPSQNWIAETMVAIVLGHLPSKQVEIAFVKSRGGHGLLLDGMNSQPTSKSSLNKNVGTDIVIPSLRPSVSFWFVKNT